LAGIGTLAFRTHEYVSGPRYQANTRAMTLGVSIFWHYLDFLWLVLFGFLLFWKR
jgi:heme/copper-type cytochrome/quinol oxidase subunit 3